MKINHILAKPDQHLRRRLPSDAAIDVRLAGKIICQLPEVGDGIPEEYDSILSPRRSFECGISRPITCQLPEIVREDGYARGTVLIWSSESAGRNRRLRRRGLCRLLREAGS